MVSSPGTSISIRSRVADVTKQGLSNKRVATAIRVIIYVGTWTLKGYINAPKLPKGSHMTCNDQNTTEVLDYRALGPARYCVLGCVVFFRASELGLRVQEFRF